MDRFEVRAKSTKMGKLTELKDKLLSRLKDTFVEVDEDE